MIKLTIDQYLLPAQREVVDHIQWALTEVARSDVPVCVLWIAPPGSGKSELFRILERHIPNNKKGDQVTRPFLAIEMPHTGEASALLRVILDAAGIPLRATRTTKPLELMADTFDALETQDVSCLAVEELHNALKKGSAEFKGQGAEMLKFLINATGRPKRVLFASTTGDIEKVLEPFEELRTRFIVVRTHRLGFSEEADPPAFRQVAMEIAKKQGVDGYITTADELAFPRLMFSIDSNLRQLNTLLARFASLVDDANASGRAVDTLALLSKAVASVTNKPESENPFLWSDEFLGERVAAAMNRRAR